MADRIGTGTWIKKKTAITEGEGGGADAAVIKETWNGTEAAYSTFIASYSRGDAHPGTAALKLQSIETTWEKDRGESVLTYALPDVATSQTRFKDVPAAGTEVQRADSSVSEYPLEQNANFSGSWLDPNDPDYKDGAKTFFVAGSTYAHTEYIDNWTWTQANLTTNVNKRFTGAQMAAYDLASATDYKWCLISITAESMGDGITKVDRRWQFNDDTWNQDLHPNAT
ncbi:MAG: hypothetical protein ACO3MW_07905 [Rhodospirillales bacterium]